MSRGGVFFFESFFVVSSEKSEGMVGCGFSKGCQNKKWKNGSSRSRSLAVQAHLWLWEQALLGFFSAARWRCAIHCHAMQLANFVFLVFILPLCAPSPSFLLLCLSACLSVSLPSSRKCSLPSSRLALWEAR